MNKRILLFLIIFLILPSLVFSIKTFVIQETEKLILKVNASDPDADRLTTTYAPPLNDKGEWQTNYGDAGQYKTKITVSDGILNASKDVLIVVAKKEESPKIDSYSPNESILNIKEGENIYFRVSANDIDKDQLSYAWLFDGKKVKDSQDYQYSASYYDSGTHDVSVEVSDGTTTLSKDWIVNIADVDRIPVFEEIGNKIINENQTLTIVLNATDPDGDSITYSANNMPQDAQLNGNIFTWTPSFDTVKKSGIVDYFIDAFGVLNKNFYVQFAASSKGKKVVQNVVITVKYVNRGPEIEDMQPITVYEGQLIKILPIASDPDGDKVSLRYSGFMNADTYQTKYGDAETYYVKVTATDGKIEASKNVQINILKADRAPVFNKINGIKATEGDNIVILLNAYDPDGDLLNYSIENPPPNSAVKGNTFYWTPGYDTAKRNEIKKFDFVFKATDGRFEAKQIAKVQIANKNRVSRIINASGNIAARVNEPVLMYVNAVDNDKDPLKYTWDFGFFDKYEATPNHERIFTSPGLKVVKVTVSDGSDSVEQIINVDVTGVQGQSSGFVSFAVRTFNITIIKETKTSFAAASSNAIAAGNTPPRITDASKNAAARVNEPVLLFVNAVDDDKDSLTYTWDFGNGEVYKATPNNLRTFTTPGDKIVKVTVSDGFYNVQYDINVKVVE